MANITASMVKELREMTGAGMMECKKALAEVDGDLEKAVDVLRTRGLAAVAKKAGRATNEGTVMTVLSEDCTSGAMIELNCETDFVAINDKFKAYAEKITRAALDAKPADLDALQAAEVDGEAVSAILTDCIHVMGENCQISRVAEMEAAAVASYIHGGGKIGVLVNLEVTGGIDATEIGKDMAMQIAALNPRFLDKSQVTQDVLDEEKKILLAQMDNDPKMASKPAQVKEKIVVGKLNKFYAENCLLQQAFVKDGDVTVEQYMNDAAKKLGGSITLKDAVRFEKGEGIEKKQENFAEEIAKLAK